MLLVNISPNIDPLYGFNTWGSDSVLLMPIASNMTDSFYASNNDNVTLYIYKKPTIIYDVEPPGTTTSININGNIVSVFPYSETVFIDDLNTIDPNIDPQFVFNSWETDSNTLLNVGALNSFYGEFNDSVILHIYKMSAFIDGNEASAPLIMPSCIQNAHQSYIIKIQTLSNHLCSYQYVNPPHENKLICWVIFTNIPLGLNSILQ